EAYGLPSFGYEHHLVSSADQASSNQLISRLQIHGDQAEAAHDRELVQTRLLNFTALGRHHHVVTGDELRHAYHRGDGLILLDIDQVAQVLAFSGTTHIRQRIGFQLVDFTTVREEQ